MTLSPSAEAAATLARLRTAESAEAFFALLDVAYDPAVLRTSRLHILKRMAGYLAGADLTALPAEAALAQARATLAQAHADFVRSSPLTERVFKVLAEHAPGAGRSAAGFVAFDDLLDPDQAED